jgi:hypothetical protein
VFIVKAAAIAAALVCVAGGTAWAHSGPVGFQAVTVFAIGPNDSYVAEYDGTPGQWTVIGGPATRVYAGSAGVFAVSPGSGDIYQYDGTPGEWTVIGGPGSEFAEAGSHLYGLGPNGAYVAEYDGTPGEWTTIRSQGAYDIYGGADGLFATSHDSAQDALEYDGTPGDWTDLGFGPVLGMAVGTNSVYAESLNGQNVDQWVPGSGWVRIGPPVLGQSGDGILAGGGGLVMEIPSAGEVVEYNGTPGSWSVISTDPFLGAEAISTDYIYGIDFAGSTTAVDLYSGSGTQWTVIGGPASAPLAAGD